MKNDSTRSQFWLPPDMDPNEFRQAFEDYFTEGRAMHIPLVWDAHPPNVPDGSHYFEIDLPRHRMDEYKPFLEDYAAKHGRDLAKSPSSGFGYIHSG